MRLVVFGLTISSSWGNGHATLWRGLCRALASMGHEVVFFERDVPYYSAHRDEVAPPGCDLRLYGQWPDAAESGRAEVARADAAIVTSYCPDALSAIDSVLTACRGVRVFYDLDTPVTLDGLQTEAPVDYVPPGGLGDFDRVLSFVGGPALDALRVRLGARRVAALYGSVDPAVHRPIPPEGRFRADLSYLGTYASDRREAIEELFVAPARRAPERRFVLGGAKYPDDFPWQSNLYLVPHVPPCDHPAFYSSASLSLNVTRGVMARWGGVRPADSSRRRPAALLRSATLGRAWTNSLLPERRSSWPGTLGTCSRRCRVRARTCAAWRGRRASGCLTSTRRRHGRARS